MFSQLILNKKIRRIIYNNKSITSNLIISNNSFLSTELLDRTVSPTKLIRTLVLLLRLFQDVLLCDLMAL